MRAVGGSEELGLLPPTVAPPEAPVEPVGLIQPESGAVVLHPGETGCSAASPSFC